MKLCGKMPHNFLNQATGFIFIACTKICRVFCLPQLPPGFAASEALG